MKHSKFHIGILFHGNKIWLSELTSIFFVILICGTLVIFSLLILKNEIYSNTLTKEFSSLKRSCLLSENELNHLRDIYRISQILYSFAGKNIPTETIIKVSELVHKNSRQFGYDPLLLLAVIHVESVFDPKALGRYRSGTLSGALGLMQLKFATAQSVAKRLDLLPLKREDLFKPEINLVLGTAYLTKLISQFKSFKLGLLAYNAGPGTIRTYLLRNEPLPLRYYKKVLRSYYNLQSIADKNISINTIINSANN
jgi:soluble lytic murein transglycosylase-like protein